MAIVNLGTRDDIVRYLMTWAMWWRGSILDAYALEHVAIVVYQLQPVSDRTVLTMILSNDIDMVPLRLYHHGDQSAWQHMACHSRDATADKSNAWHRANPCVQVK